MVVKVVSIVVLGFVFFACQKSVDRPYRDTDFSFNIKYSAFDNQKYFLKQLSVESGDDDVMDFGRIRLTAFARISGDSIVVFDGLWRELAELSFSLPQRDVYDVIGKLYTTDDAEEFEVDLHSIPIANKLPTKFKINSIEVYPEILAGNLINGVWNSLSATASVEASAFLQFSSNFTITHKEYLLQKYFAPQKRVFSFDDELIFSARKNYDEIDESIINNEIDWQSIFFELRYTFDIENSQLVRVKTLEAFLSATELFYDADRVEETYRKIDKNDSITIDLLTWDFQNERTVTGGEVKIKFIYEN